jgi:hypothetical protein
MTRASSALGTEGRTKERSGVGRGIVEFLEFRLVCKKLRLAESL